MPQTTYDADQDESKRTPAPPTSRLPIVLSWRTVAGIGLVLVAAILYALTLDNGLRPGELLGGDLITHQYAQVQARPSNAPGYPLYTMGGWLWFHTVRTPLEAISNTTLNPIPLLSSYSTLWALLALWLLYQIICMTTETTERSSGNWPVAFLVSSFYAVTYFFWYYATTTEQYSSAIAQTLAIILFLLLWLRRQDNRWLLYLLAFLCGLSLAHMLTVAFVVLPVVIVVLWTNSRLLRDPGVVIGSIVAAMLPLLAYIFVFVRGSSHPEWWGSQQYASATEWFLEFLSTSQGREELMWAFEPGRPFFGNGFPSLIGQELTWVMVIAGLIGIMMLRKPLPFVLYTTLAIYLLFSWAYRFGNWFQVILPAYALIMIGIGALTDWWQTYLSSRTEESGARSRRFGSTLAVAAPLLLLVLATLWRFDASREAADSRNRPGDSALERAAVLLSGPIPLNGAVFASVNDALALQYLTGIWRIRPDIQVVSSDQASDVIAEQPVFTTWGVANTLIEELAEPHSLSLQVASPDWIAVHSTPDTADTANSSNHDKLYVNVDAEILQNVILEAYEVVLAPNGTPVIDSQDRAFDITLLWRLIHGEWPDDVAISIRPTLDGEYIVDPDNPDGVLLTDHSAPAQLLFGANAGSGTDAIRDPYRIHFPFPHMEDEMRLGFAIVVYRQLPDGFEDVFRMDLSLPGEIGTATRPQ